MSVLQPWEISPADRLKGRENPVFQDSRVSGQNINMIQIDWNPNRRFLRQFAVLLVLFFAIVGGIQYYHGSRQLGMALAAGGAVIGLLGFALPSFMRVVYVIWMAAIYSIGWVVTHVVLAVGFYLVVTPIGVIMKLCRYDPMQRSFDRSAKSYWKPRGQQQTVERYFKQF